MLFTWILFGQKHHLKSNEWMADNARQDPRRLFVLLDLYTLVCIFHAPEKSPKGFERIKLLKTEIVVKWETSYSSFSNDRFSSIFMTFAIKSNLENWHFGKGLTRRKEILRAAPQLTICSIIIMSSCLPHKSKSLLKSPETKIIGFRRLI